MRAAYPYKLSSSVESNLPVSVAEAKLFMRVDSTIEDNLIEEFIRVAELAAENYSRRTLITKEFITYRDDWAEYDINGNILYGFEIRKNPYSSVTSIKYYDTDNNLQTLSSDNYYIVDEPAGYFKILFKDSVSLPSLYYRPNPIEITFKAGYSLNFSDIPYDLRMAIKQHVGFLYENRGDYKADFNFIPDAAKEIYNKYRIFEL